MVDLDRISKSLDPPGAETTQEKNARLMQMLWRGLWLLVGLPLVFGAGTYVYFSGYVPGFKVTPLYRATTKIQIASRVLDPLQGSQPLDARPGSIAKQQEKLFRSQSILRPLAEIPEVKELRVFQEDPGKPVIAYLMEGISAYADSKTDQVSIHFVSPSRKAGTVVVENAVEVYFDYHEKLARQNAQDAIAVLETERANQLTRAAELEASIRAEQKKHRIAGADLRNPFEGMLEAHTQSGQQALQDLHVAEVELDRVEAAAADPEAFLDYGARRRTTQPISVFEETIAQYVRTRQDLLTERLNLAKIRPEGHPALLEIDQRRETLQAEIDDVHLQYAAQGLREARDSVLEQRQRYEKFQEKVREIEADYFEIEEILAVLRTRQAELTEIRNDISTFSRRIAALGVSKSIGGVNVEVVETAFAGQMPVYPETEKFSLMAAVFGFALAVGLVLLRGHTDRRIWTVEEVPSLLGSDVVGVFPALPTSKRPKVGRIVEEDPASIAAESVRSLRTSCSFGLPDNGKGIVFVTSSVSGEGKSVVASNLAIAFAQSGRKTLLLDADLRSPGQNEIFAVIGKRGFGDALAGEAGDYETGVVRSITAEGLDLLPAGDSSGGAAELVEGGSIRELLARLREDYDCVVIDSSPVLETAETRIVASLSDLVVFVMRMNVSTAPNGQRAVGILRNVGAEILGVMLNGGRMRRGARSYSGGMAYGYGDGYGYGQYRKPDGASGDVREVASRDTPPPDSTSMPAVGDAGSRG